MGNFKQELLKKISIAFLMLIMPIIILVFLGLDINKKAVAAKANRQNLADRSEELSLYAKLQSQATEAESYTSVLDNVLPSKDQLIDFQKNMEILATQSKVGFGFTFGNETPSTDTEPGRMGFSMTSSGSLGDIMNFIKSMGDSRFMIDFKSFDFAGSSITINGEVLFR